MSSASIRSRHRASSSAPWTIAAALGPVAGQPAPERSARSAVGDSGRGAGRLLPGVERATATRHAWISSRPCLTESIWRSKAG
ncbi:hypothetical protein C0Z10_01065 [Acidipropionibacterium jensenii]|uniref:Uncharacterized protein n=1 Tax=Acidipropionibacterium jensenii TaxID=1749 RepID=A0A3Q9UJG7_9ACTN|nr:hypothetical protein C0Z10_01065 [Acidipropionibacterium jensenii]